jgi:hypothetical protein
MVVWWPPAPDPSVRRLLELSQVGVSLESTPKIPALAGGWIPRLVPLKIGARRITDVVKAQKLRGIMKKL